MRWRVKRIIDFDTINNYHVFSHVTDAVAVPVHLQQYKYEILIILGIMGEVVVVRFSLKSRSLSAIDSKLQR